MPLRPLTTALVTGLLLVACATSPLGRRQLMLVSQSEVTEMGIASYRDMQKKTPATKDPKLSGYVNCVARKVTAEIPGNQQWEVTVFDSKDINAFALTHTLPHLTPEFMAAVEIIPLADALALLPPESPSPVI